MLSAAITQYGRWGIAPDDAERAGMFDVADASTVYQDFKPLPAIVIPYHNTDGSLMTFDRGPFCRVRYLESPRQPGLVAHKPLRYGQPKASCTRAYFAPIVDWQSVMADANEPIILTEGEGKALAGVLADLPVVGFGGVFNWSHGDGLLPELEAFNWKGRDTYICFDSDAVCNPDILCAEARLVDELQRKRGAKCFLVRLPQDSDEKCGLDDFLMQKGVAAFTDLLKNAPSLGALDAKVVSLNKTCAWIERENLVYDLESTLFVPKDSFVNGSRFSALTHITVGGKQRSEPKNISVAAVWLKHPHAQRFSEILFRPNEGVTVTGDNGRPALNMWNGFESEPGDVTPFLQLTEFLFSKMEPQYRELPLKLIAYKAQNPQEKVPLALVLIGKQGCGKTLWGECVRDAFAPYSVDVTPSSLAGEFQGWLERSLIALVNEAKGEDMMRAAEQLKALISDLKRPMNEKYRPVRQINTYTSYIITSNNRAVGAFSADDRRMIVVNCPDKMTDAAGQALYDTLGQRNGAWYKAGGPKHLLHYLLNLDLQGWKPPTSAPMTSEKYMAFVESLTPTQRLAEEMRTASDQNVKLWLDGATAWARQAELSNNPFAAAQGRACLAAAEHYQLRPWYTPEELTLMFPAITEQTLGGKWNKTTPAGQVSRELREAGVPYLRCADDPKGFRHKGAIRQYLVVCDQAEWTEPLRQADFDHLMSTWPSYGTASRRAA